jgi:hypothetical protein
MKTFVTFKLLYSDGTCSLIIHSPKDIRIIHIRTSGVKEIYVVIDVDEARVQPVVVCAVGLLNDPGSRGSAVTPVDIIVLVFRSSKK